MEAPQLIIEQLSSIDGMRDGREVYITGQGADIWGANDSFFYTHIGVPDTITGKIFTTEVYTKDGFGVSSSSHEWAKAGLMVRDSLTPDSKHFSSFVTPYHGTNGKTNGGLTTRITGDDSLCGGVWLRIDRSGSAFRAYYRKDNDQSCTLITEAYIEMIGSVHVGVAVCSHMSYKSDSVLFSRFSMKVSSAFSLVLVFGFNFASNSCGTVLLRLGHHLSCL